MVVFLSVWVNVNQFIGDKEMITVEDKEIIRRAYYIEHKSIRQIQRETGYHRKTIRKALDDGMVPEYNEKEPRPTPALTPVKGIIDHWLAEARVLRMASNSDGKPVHKVHLL